MPVKKEDKPQPGQEKCSCLRFHPGASLTTHDRLDSLVSVWANPRVLVVQAAVDVGAVVEGAVASLDGASPPLVHEVPVEAGEGTVLVALVLEKGLALLYTKFFEIPGGGGVGRVGREGGREGWWEERGGGGRERRIDGGRERGGTTCRSGHKPISQSNHGEPDNDLPFSLGLAPVSSVTAIITTMS